MIPADDILDRLSALFNTLILETINWDFGSSFLVKAVFARLLRLLGDPDLFSINRIHSHSQGQEYLFSKISHIMRSSHGRCTREELEMLLHYNGEYLNRIVKNRPERRSSNTDSPSTLRKPASFSPTRIKVFPRFIEELGFPIAATSNRLFKNAFGENAYGLPEASPPPVIVPAQHRFTKEKGMKPRPASEVPFLFFCCYVNFTLHHVPHPSLHLLSRLSGST